LFPPIHFDGFIMFMGLNPAASTDGIADKPPKPTAMIAA
jgi:hypothetical protein